MKGLLNLLPFLVLLVSLLNAGCSDKKSDCPTANCDKYYLQSEAQAAYVSDPTCNKGLDADSDGIACEDLPASTTAAGCPTTANCGCSNKNKDACGGVCCEWVVGDGCNCR